MAYTYDNWKNRIANRTDISMYLTHLTRKNDKLGPIGVLIKILKEKKLIGSTTASGFIVGTNPAVCFQESPLYGICQNTLHEQLLREQATKEGNSEPKVRYVPIGLAFKKNYVYSKGGRPVIYEKTEIAKKLLPPDEWWRIVDFNLGDTANITDWTHEREWRIKGDFHFDLSQALILIIDANSYKYFIKKAGEDILDNIGGITVLHPVLL